MVSAKTIFAYLAYTLLAAVIFLYLLFPDQAVKAYMDGRLAAFDSALGMEAEAIRPALPPGIKMSGVDLTREGVRLVRFDNARVSPVLSSLLKKDKQFKFQADTAGGSIAGRGAITPSGPSGLLRAEAELSRIRLEELDAVKKIDRLILTGLLAGHMTHDGGSSATGVTSGALTVSDLRITLKAPFFGLSDLLVDQADTMFSISGRNLRLKALNFGGPMVEGKITGSIEMRRPFGKSRLNLSGNAKPQPELLARLQETIAQGIINTRTMGTRGLTFRIRGSVDNPDVSMR